MTVTEDQHNGHPLGAHPPVQSSGSAREAVNEMLDAGLLDDVMDRVDAGGLTLTGEGGFLPEMIKAVLDVDGRPDGGRFRADRRSRRAWGSVENARL